MCLERSTSRSDDALAGREQIAMHEVVIDERNPGVGEPTGSMSRAAPRATRGRRRSQAPGDTRLQREQAGARGRRQRCGFAQQPGVEHLVRRQRGEVRVDHFAHTRHVVRDVGEPLRHRAADLRDQLGDQRVASAEVHEDGAMCFAGCLGDRRRRCSGEAAGGDHLEACPYELPSRRLALAGSGTRRKYASNRH